MTEGNSFQSKIKKKLLSFQEKEVLAKALFQQILL